MALLSGIAGAPASAALPTHEPGGKRHGVVAGPGKVRLCTKITLPGCYGRGIWQYGAHVAVICEKAGTNAVGRYRSNRYYYISNAGRKAYIHSSWIRGERNDVPSCQNFRGAMAIHWAAKRVGEVKPRAAKRGLGINNGQWSGWCATLTHAAYELGAGTGVQFAGNARPRYFAYKSAGVMQPWNPWKAKIGSMVFWPYLSQFGHTAIYAGRGLIVTTRGSSGVSMPVGVVPVSWYGTPAGWVAPEDV